MLINNNHNTAKAETPTYLLSQETPTNKTEEKPETFRVDLRHPERAFWIGSSLHPHEKTLLKHFLSENSDVFAWSPTDMPGIDPEVICHKLSIKTDAKLVKQKPKRMDEERSRAINDEVDRLFQAGFIREMFYSDWLFNPVVTPRFSKYVKTESDESR